MNSRLSRSLGLQPISYPSLKSDTLLGRVGAAFGPTKQPSTVRFRYHGFTLLEILIALAILGVGFITLIGLQSSAVSITLNDGDRLGATMVARRILAHLEATRPALNPTDTTGSPSTIISQFATTPDLRGELDDANYRVHLQIEPWAPEGLNPNLLKRITLTVSWGNGANDFVRVLYFAVREQDDSNTESDTEEIDADPDL